MTDPDPGTQRVIAMLQAVRAAPLPTQADPEVACPVCGGLYRGAAEYCSLSCALEGKPDNLDSNEKNESGANRDQLGGDSDDL